MGQFNITVQDIATRENLISEKRKNPVRTEPFYQYLPQGIPLPVIHVDIALPVYRMANWRTRTKQMSYIRREQLGHDFFQSGEENVTAQRVQHDILIEFANRGRGETIIPIMQKLRQDRRQMESLLVTSTGVVVNGNRRLAAMRELFAEEPGNYPFQHVEIAVLPKGVTPPDLKKIEFQLQMQQETKLPYDWAIQCLSVRELAGSGVSQEEIQHMMRLSRVEDVQAMINRLNEAELYLSDYLQTPEDYSAVDRQEQQFIELQRAIDRKSDAAEKELARKMCYVITRHSRELETRAYDFKVAFGKKTKEVAERLAERMNVELREENGGGDSDSNDDIFSDEAAAQTAARFEPVRQLLSDPNQSESLADAIADICIEIKEENQGEQDTKKALKQVKKAKSLLWSVNIEKAGEETIDEIRSDLEEIQSTVDELLRKLPGDHANPTE
jgi:hypothetical protein